MKCRQLPALFLLLLTPAAAQDWLVPAGSLERAADGEPICGLGRDFHSGRRALLREKVESGVLVFRGLGVPRANVSFSQDKAFWYLTGVETPDAALVMDAASGREVLFVNRPSEWRERWEGEIWDADDEWVAGLTGISEVRPRSEFMDVLGEMMAEQDGARPALWTSLSAHVELAGSYDAAGPYDKRRKKDPLDGRQSREEMLAEHLGKKYDVEVQDVESILYEMRRVKTPEEIDAIRRAGRAGALAISEGMRSTRPGLGEWELDALLTWIQQRHGAAGIAYAAIVGSGVNSLTLHYNFSTRRMRDGEVVLIDFGPEVDHYVTDITRTWPVNGKFTERQAELYDAVLDAQKAGIAAAKPGATVGEVDGACSKVLQERGFQRLMRHGAVHYVGMEVHDVGSTRTVLEPGVCFTIEPGLYEAATGIGIRIEDVVVITEDGCEVVTADAPKERDAIEALIAETGVLELVDPAVDFK
ncbi:MAG: aminopeptidase P family protein [bacterium]|nr:aminopeptidase P family protein [bacterium]